jgi:hypothetical protein
MNKPANIIACHRLRLHNDNDIYDMQIVIFERVRTGIHGLNRLLTVQYVMLGQAADNVSRAPGTTPLAKRNSNSSEDGHGIIVRSARWPDSRQRASRTTSSRGGS